jgi:hypothetical protein
LLPVRGGRQKTTYQREDSSRPDPHGAPGKRGRCNPDGDVNKLLRQVKKAGADRHRQRLHVFSVLAGISVISVEVKDVLIPAALQTPCRSREIPPGRPVDFPCRQITLLLRSMQAQAER